MTSIPAVKDQVKRWATGKRDETPGRETIAARELRMLGSVGRSQFATTKAGVELKIRGPVQPYALEDLAPDAVIITKPARTDAGRVVTEVFIGRPVEAGTFERLAKRKSYRPKERTPGPVDRDHALRDGLPRQPIALGKDDDSPEGFIKGAMSRVPALMITDGRARLRSVADEIAFLARSGITLALSDDGNYLLATVSKALTAERQAMLDIRASLYRAHLKGESMRCVWPHGKDEAPPAVTIAVGGAPVCDAHLRGGVAE
jgi:hypothetical protein